jgi:6-bladed beta-propeller protein
VWRSQRVRVGGVGAFFVTTLVALPLAAQDTVVVRADNPPVWGSNVRVVRDLRIGAVEGADEYLFGRITSLAVRADGAIYVLDGQARSVREYDAAGRFVRAYGRQGSGPGELNGPEAIAVTRDGKLLVRDRANARIAVFDRSGVPVAHWPFPSSYGTNAPMFTDTAGHVLTDVVVRDMDGRSPGQLGLLRYRSDGRLRDTLPWPTWNFQRREVVVNANGGVARYKIPYDPDVNRTYSPHGYFVGGVSTRYAIDLIRPASTVLRIQRRHTPVPVGAAERASIRESMRSVRNGNDPAAQGPNLAAVKPPFTSIRVDNEGRIWVQVPGRSTQHPSPQREQPPLWVSSDHYDVFSPSGQFLGTVRFPERFTPLVIRGDHVWGVEQDELDVNYVARYRIVR